MNPMLVDPMAAGFTPLTLESRLLTSMNGKLDTHLFESDQFWQASISDRRPLEEVSQALARLIERGLVESQQVHDDECGWYHLYRLNRNYRPTPIKPSVRVRLSSLAERIS